MMRLSQRSGVCALALMAGMAAMQFEPAILSDLAFGNGNHRVTVGAVRTSLWSAAFAQSADSFSLENVRFTAGVFTYEAKRLDFSGLRTTRQEIETLFSSSPESLAERLARVSATQITAPEIKVTQKLGKETQTALYRNVSINNLVNGRAASVTAETTAVEETDPKGGTLTSFGRSEIKGLDGPAFARLYEKGSDASAPLSKIYDAFSIDKIDVVDNAQNTSITIANVSGRDILARPTKDSWNGTMALIAELADKDELSQDEQARLTYGAADLLGAFDAGFLEATDIRFKTGKTQDESAGSIARIAYTGATGSQPADLRLEGFEARAQDSLVKIGGIGLTGFSITPTLNGLKALQGKSLDEINHADMRTLIPTLGTLRASDIYIDGPSEEKDGRKPERVIVTMKGGELTADKPVNGIPTHVRIEQRDLTMALPPDSSDEFITSLLDLGYRAVTSSLLVEATWNESTNEIALKQVSGQTEDMGSFALTGTLGNAGRDLFSADEATAAAALIGMKAKSAEVTIENKGLFQRYLEKTAKEQNTSPETLQAMYAGAAPLVVASLIGNSEQAKTLSQAVARFIAKPGKLTINAQPKNPSGFGMMDVMLASDPKKIIEKLDISANVE